jgi:hypothetical protein
MTAKRKAELRQVALDIVGGRIFTDRDCPNESGQMVFMALVLMKPKQIQHLRKHAGMIYEYYSKAGPWSCNGLPMFTSMRWLNKQDTRFVVKKVKEFLSVIKSVK